MATESIDLLISRKHNLIKKWCRKNGVRKDQVDDCIQEIALKALLTDDAKKVLNSNAFDYCIKSMLRKEFRYQKYLLHLQEKTQESIIHPYSLQIDVRSIIISMPQSRQNICKLLAAGFTRKQIARKLKICTRTLNREINVIKEKLIKCCP